MSKGKQDDEHSLVQQHALKRLDKVEEEQQKPYKKKKEPFNFRSILMGALLIIVLAMMLFSYFL
ncbi:hypothetical protein [Limosilactobacillus walteri]|uniref:Uncharacterized protein n=1 Tax=Limosilactobacillus walteri TaxID=2268022 RepID=A0ABR8P8W7_9LACO|nr:hypothetical protein [Limosilactobacillus walteri]MBD5807155.1 hypothetical protein [Limosilactobacillus walteri]